MKYGELNLGQIEAVINRLGGMSGVERFLAGGLVLTERLAEITEGFQFTIDYTHKLEAMIAAGRYDWTNSDVTAKRFPLVGEGIIEFESKLFHFDRSVSSEQAVELIKADDTTNPYEPAKIEHLLSFGAKFPEEQRKYPIIGLGSVARVGGRRFVPYLHGSDAERRLDLHWFVFGWSPGCRFLGVRKLPSAASA